MEEQKKTLYTEEGYQALLDELKYLKGDKMKQIKESIAQARSFGDLSENDEYKEAKDEQSIVASRIEELEQLILNAEVIKKSEVRTDIIHLGSRVKLKDLDEKEEIEYSIVGTNQANPFENKISDQSPIGSALLEKKVGDKVKVTLQNGVVLNFKVLEISKDK